MPVEKKKIFFSHSDSEDDKMYFQNLCLHFGLLKDKVELLYKGKILAGSDTAEELKKHLDSADALITLLSVNYFNDDNCVEQFKSGFKNKKTVFPVLVSSFDVGSVEELKEFESTILPENGMPLESQEKKNAAYTEIVQQVKHELLNEHIPEKSNSKLFYWILGAIVFLIGVLATIWGFNFFSDWMIRLCIPLMFCCILLLTFKPILFPTRVSNISI